MFRFHLLSTFGKIHDSNVWVRQQVCFYNCNTGKIFFDDQPTDLKDENNCFDMILDEQTPAGEDLTQEFDGA